VALVRVVPPVFADKGMALDRGYHIVASVRVVLLLSAVRESGKDQIHSRLRNAGPEDKENRSF